MDLSIIIPVKDDTQIKQCILSIDENVEIVVALNDASENVKAILNEFSVTIVELPEANLARALNLGIDKAKNDKVLLMDSDCIFEKGTIKKIFDGLDSAPLSKGYVKFSYNNFSSAIVSKVRSFTTSDFCNAYKPPLAFKKNIINKLGYYFDPELKWEEDLDFNNRVRLNNLKIYWDKSAIIYHPPLTFESDLKAAYNYGTGHAYGLLNGKFVIENRNSLEQKKIKKFQKCVLVKTKGRIAYLYYCLWKFFYKRGMMKILREDVK